MSAVEHAYVCRESTTDVPCPFVATGAHAWHNFQRHYNKHHPHCKLTAHAGSQQQAEQYKLTFCLELIDGKATAKPALSVQDLSRSGVAQLLAVAVCCCELMYNIKMCLRSLLLD